MADQIDVHETGAASFPSAHVRIGIWAFSNDPGLVRERPGSRIFSRSRASLWSIVAVPMRTNRSA
ncbi:hypothetical protein [Arthrobacter sp. ISL-65]|uniref:hypothetical protein n=1 Tax=Arthrobacter sp. ISL-65 TaxID=2819112 RepID=UPI001BE812D6|nr:hypothetical protein [Arthrobacter sp. ISL-65]MBT2550255.1 hypothetical protein [Arthrobacter sp. ISL-65]